MPRDGSVRGEGKRPPVHEPPRVGERSRLSAAARLSFAADGRYTGNVDVFPAHPTLSELGDPPSWRSQLKPSVSFCVWTP